MMASDTFWLAVLGALVLYLFCSVNRRTRRADRILSQSGPGSAFEVSKIATQVQHVRQDHLAAFPHQACPPSGRRHLVASARRTVTDLAYFRDAQHEDELATSDSLQNHGRVTSSLEQLR